MAEKRKNRLTDYTEHAMLHIDGVIPTLGYVPPTKRAKKQFVLITKNAPVDVKINLERVALADPIGFLVALMQGQPVPMVKVEKDGACKTEWITADLDQRAWLGRYFSDKLIPYMTRTRLKDMEDEGKQRGKGDDDEMETLMRRVSQSPKKDGA